jgi:hypothetical protein
MPTMCDGKSLVNGKRNPVTLVRMVVARKIAVHAGTRFEPNIAKRTTSPARIPIKLRMT